MNTMLPSTNSSIRLYLDGFPNWLNIGLSPFEILFPLWNLNYNNFICLLNSNKTCHIQSPYIFLLCKNFAYLLLPKTSYPLVLLVLI